MQPNHFILVLLFFYFPISNVKSQSAVTLSLQAYKIGYDKKRNNIYATVKGNDASYANSFVSIDPATGNIENSLPVGSEPRDFVFTSDSNYVFIAFQELAMVKRIDLNTFTVSDAFTLGSDSWNGSYFARNLATVEGENNLVVVSRLTKNSSPDFMGVAVYKNGVKLPKEIPIHSSYTPSQIISTGKDTLYGKILFSSSNEIYALVVNRDSGIYVAGESGNHSMQEFVAYENGLLFGSSGYIVDTRYSQMLPSGKVEVNSMSSFGKYGLIPDYANHKIFSAKMIGSDFVVQSFDYSTLGRKDTFIIKNAFPGMSGSGAVSSLIRFGRRGLAAIAFDDYSFTSLVPQVFILNDLNIVDTHTVGFPVTPRPFFYDTIVTYETVKVLSNDTLFFPLFSSFGSQPLLATFKAYPNSTSDQLVITRSTQTASGPQVARLFDANGSFISEFPLQEGDTYCDLSSYAKGVYILEVASPWEQATTRKKIILQ